MAGYTISWILRVSLLGSVLGTQKQWHLDNTAGHGGDLKVGAFWKQGITGKGVTVAVVDDGINHKHPDLSDNYNPQGSYDFVGSDTDPMPDEEGEHHGTAVAGIIAGKKGGKCGTGIAFDASISAIKLFGKINGKHVESGLNHQLQVNDIYSSSWGQGMEQDMTRELASPILEALEWGARSGRDRKGAVYVFASGNNAGAGNNCAFNGYANSIFTITVGAIDKDDLHLEYSEGCAGLMVMGYSATFENADIHTTGHPADSCRSNFTGVSAATPMVSGVIALALSKRPELTWRDVQHLLVKSARQVNPDDPTWRRTFSGRYFSNLYGYGVIDGKNLLGLMQLHQLVEDQVAIKSQSIKVNSEIPQNQAGLESYIHITRELLGDNRHLLAEHIVVTLSAKTVRRRNLRVYLISPNQVKSTLLIPRTNDFGKDGFTHQKVLTLSHWDEPAVGIWTLHITNKKSLFSNATLIEWGIEIFGRVPSAYKPSMNITTTERPIDLNFHTEL